MASYQILPEEEEEALRNKPSAARASPDAARLREPLLAFPANEEEIKELPDPFRHLPTRLHEFFHRSVQNSPHAIALVCGSKSYTYKELDEQTNQFAHFLRRKYGAGPEKTIGIILERGFTTYLALLAILKSGAAYVPFDAQYPADRVAFIAEDASLILLITSSTIFAQHAAGAASWPCPHLLIDTMSPQLAGEVASMPTSCPVDLAPDQDPLAYIIYTSGTTGKPKGVAVAHLSVCHEIAGVTMLYGITPHDRCYQGITIAFDFSVEEIWIAWAGGASLIAGTDPRKKVGPDLNKFLIDERVTVFGGVPTLLSTLDKDMPDVRVLIVGGEHCPAEMVDRWCRPGRQMFNTYGPTETTITSSMIELHPGKPVTIGFPLPGYTWYVLDDNLNRLPDGEIGEIVIGGVGVTRGYINRPDLTAAKFIPDPFIGSTPLGAKLKNPKMYRSGDRGRINPANGEMEIMGRADDQIKLRGYRFEMQEVVALLLEDPAVSNAAVTTLPPGGPPQDLAAYVTLRADAYDAKTNGEHDNVITEKDIRERLADRLRAKLPTFIVPAYIEFLDQLPTLPSGKTDRKLLPLPSSERIQAVKKAGMKIVPPANEIESRIAQSWSNVFGGAEMSVEADFFLDLGGHSLFAAQCISALRNSEPTFANLSVADLYGNPTIRLLAEHVSSELRLSDPSVNEYATPSVAGTSLTNEDRPRTQVFRKQYSSWRIWLCGLVQLAFLYVWTSALMGPVVFVILHYKNIEYDVVWVCVLIGLPIFFPILFKWLLLGKIRAGRHELWSWYYVRFWIVRKILLFSPIGVLAGSPLLGPFVSLFGAEISRKAHVASAFFGLPDLIEIQEGACVGYQVVIQPFIIEDGWLELAPVRIEKDACVGTGCFLMAGAVVEEGATLSDQTLVSRYQRIPRFENWAGSPARKLPTKDPLLTWIEQQEPYAHCYGNCFGDFIANAMLSIAYILTMLVMSAMPVAAAVPSVYFLIYIGDTYDDSNAVMYFMPVAGVGYFFVMCFLVVVVKWIVLHGLKPGVYPLWSVFAYRKWFSDKLMELSLRMNYSLYSTLYTVPFLRLLGAKVGNWSEVSTVQHIEPDLLQLGDGVFIADMASIGAATFYRGCLALAPCRVGDRTFIGNSAIVRGDTVVPGKCLIGVHSVPPITAMTPGTSFLGAPSMALPRRQIVEGFAEDLTYAPRPLLVVYRLFVEFFRILVPPIIIFYAGYFIYFGVEWVSEREKESLRLKHSQHTLQFWLLLYVPIIVFIAGFATVFLVVVLKWVMIGRYKKQMVPLWAPFVRHTEFVTGIYEGILVPFMNVFGGSPMLAPLLRLFGVKIGSRVYLDTADITEFDLVDIEDDATVCGPTSLQTHLFEDRIMKMSVVKIKQRANVGARCVVLYDAVIGEDARLEPLSLVMKNESLPPNTSWRGIPCRCFPQTDRALLPRFELSEVLVGATERTRLLESTHHDSSEDLPEGRTKGHR